MYDIDIKKIGNRIRDYRKANNMTIEELGKIIGKTKATVAKYETGEIVIDVVTALEICNALNIDFNDICNVVSSNAVVEKQRNPFGSNFLYLYYISRNGLVISTLELEERNHSINVLMKNGLTFNKSKPYLQEYSGIMESNYATSFICLTNAITNPGLDKFQIEIDLRSKDDKGLYSGAFLGISNYNRAPTARKCILTTKKLFEKDEMKRIFNKLKVTREEALNIEEVKYWDFKTRNLNDFVINLDD